MKKSRSEKLHFEQRFMDVYIRRVEDGRFDPILNVTDQQVATVALKEEVAEGGYDEGEVSRRIRVQVAENWILWRYGQWTIQSEEGKRQKDAPAKWRWNATRTAHPYFQVHGDKLASVSIETEGPAKYPTHDQKLEALRGAIPELVVHQLPSAASEGLEGEEKKQMGTHLALIRILSWKSLLFIML